MINSLLNFFSSFNQVVSSIFLVLLLSFFFFPTNLQPLKSRYENINSSRTNSIYVELTNFNNELRNCLFEKLVGKCYSSYLQETDPKSSTSSNNHYQLNCFFNFSDFNNNQNNEQSQKIGIVLHQDTLTNLHPKFSLKRYHYDTNGEWRLTMNLGNFDLSNHPIQNINPVTSEIENWCNQIFRMVVVASFK